MPPPSPPHATITLAEIIEIEDFIDTSCQNINPLTTEDLSKILHQSTQQAQLCTSPVLVSVDELQRAVAAPQREKVKPKEQSFTYTTTKILLLPPPSPPKAITNELQVLSAAIGEDRRKLE